MKPNKNLYKANKQDTFYDRMIILFFHLSFLLKVYKNNVSKKELQNFFDYFVRQIELSIREIGYGDVSVNKKMKDYVNLFYSILEKIENWDIFDSYKKTKLLGDLMNIKDDNDSFIEYFDK